MASDRRTETGRVTIRALTKREIDRRIQGLVEEVALLRKGRAAAEGEPADPLRPRWIEPADLVQRLRKFVVYN